MWDMGITVTCFLFSVKSTLFAWESILYVYLNKVDLLCNSRFPRAMSFQFIPLMAEVHKALLYKDNDAWHFLEIHQLNISSKPLLHVQNRKLWKMFVYNNYSLEKSQKVNLKKSHETPFLWKECCPGTLPRSFAEKTEMRHVIFPGNSHVLGSFILFCVAFDF